MENQDSDHHPFDGLGPDRVLEAAVAAGLATDGRLLALNSYENRVWQIGLEDADPVIAKFYRPDRWTDEAILEEHRFAHELAEGELSVVEPMAFEGRTLLDHAGFRYALFPRQGGHAPEPEHEPTLRALGRALGRMHAVGGARSFEHRGAISPAALGERPRRWLLEHDWIPPHLESAFESLTGDLMAHVQNAWKRAGDFREIRLHGDCHPGNILWRDGPHFVDLDDCRTGPAVQDLWMLVSGERAERESQWEWLLEEYALFADFDARELQLVEPLRALRMIHYQAWLAQRWDDPAFPRAFPWFDDDRHWETVIGQLREQLSEMQEPAVEWRR
ncbi:MAG: serine/threonine protein kinase [Wenzhouxiangellaceae bacterium]|nr:serine/threonine protein kinase [Wenzhouxiangellaceae bacterium]